MKSGRLEAFSDGVIAIIITIMVLELHAPHGAAWSDLDPLLPVALAYVLSFVHVGIYWNNHHHLFQLVDRVDGRVLWANLHVLFWLSLFPFGTAWSGASHWASLPTAFYGSILLLAGIAWTILVTAILRCQGHDSTLAAAVGRTGKEKASIALYVVAIPVAFVWSALAVAIYVLVAAMWFVPDRRVETRM
jgi:TMEM175 potassium channel family protein